jgi:hypothetical protein
VNGASPYASWPLLLPVRGQGGKLAFKPALLRRSADSAPGYLPVTRANIIRQAFKLLGERYGWGHQFNARDCSGLTSEVYRSMGVLLPPSSGLQGTSTAFQHRSFTDKDSHADRVRALAEAEVGDLVVVPGHVLMIIGHLKGEPYVIQDVPYAVFKDPASGQLRKTKLNQVVGDAAAAAVCGRQDLVCGCDDESGARDGINAELGSPTARGVGRRQCLARRWETKELADRLRLPQIP